MNLKGMFEDQFYISELIAACLQDRITPDQEVDLNKWLETSEQNRILFDEFFISQQFDADLLAYQSANKDLILNNAMTKINEKKSINKSTRIKMFFNRNYRITAAAVILILSFLGTYFYTNNNVIQGNNIKPGKNTATLTLANGKKIVLSNVANGKLATEAGVVISKTSNGNIVYEIKDQSTSSNQMNILSTARGETYQVQLPDGSKVWLNAATTLKYPSSFTSSRERVVELNGEAYFEIFKDKTRPFKVNSLNQTVEVLGTHFNVNSYKEEPTINTILVEGSVKINKTTILKPGEQADFYRPGNIAVSKADLNAIAWKEGKFRFNNTSLEAVLRQLARWYNVDFIYEGKISDRKISGGIDRNINIADALEILGYMNIHYKIDGRKIIVTE